jgi:hypothetical protein
MSIHNELCNLFLQLIQKIFAFFDTRFVSLLDVLLVLWNQMLDVNDRTAFSKL